MDNTSQSASPQSLSILPQQQQSTWVGRAAISININENCGANITGNSSCDVNINAYCSVNLNGNSACNVNVNSQCNINFNGNSSCRIDINSSCNASMNGNVNCHVSNHCNIRMNGKIKMNGNINCSVRDKANALTSARKTATTRIQATRAVLPKPAPMDKAVSAQHAPKIVKTEEDSIVMTAPPAKRRKLDQPIAEVHGTVDDQRKGGKMIKQEQEGSQPRTGPADMVIKQEQDSNEAKTYSAERRIKQEEGFNERRAGAGEKRVKQEEAY